MTQKEFMKYSENIELHDRRLLNFDQFRAYAGDIRKSTAERFLRDHDNMLRRVDGEVLIDRIAFDDWCKKDTVENVIETQFPKFSMSR